MVYAVGVSWSQALRLVVKVRQSFKLSARVSQSEVHMGRGESGDSLVTVDPMDDDFRM